ncbi:MAG: hypothetical protein OEU26_28080, partial [Candidatus Tectomicrobia bacterium]|nr:hypothetical protein [Candidatus Tectomicrobia bacterium]
FFHITPMTILFDAAQLLYNALAMRGIFLALLLFVVLQHQTGYGYAMLVFIYVLIPQFASMMSHFKESFFLLAIALCSQWHPWSPLPSDRRRSRYIAWAMVGTATALLLMAVLWEGGIKPRWRPAIMQGTVSGSPIQKLKAFSFLVQDATAELDVFFASQALVARLSSGVGFFSRVLDRVPDVIPYERGSLTLRALQHSVKPRFLFPDKPDLGSDSWLVWKYAGMRAAKETKDTSIGLGYMAEFYIDFGIPGMFAPLFAYGLLIGIVYRSVDLFAPSPPLFHSLVTIIFLQHFMSYEGEVAKLLGGLIQTWLLFLLFLYICGSWVHTHLQRRVETEARLYAH